MDQIFGGMYLFACMFEDEIKRATVSLHQTTRHHIPEDNTLSGTSVNFYQKLRRHIPGDRIPSETSVTCYRSTRLDNPEDSTVLLNVDMLLPGYTAS
jgi:hypothetical protein